MPFVVDLHAVHATMTALVGGKAANLGEMLRAGLPVPPGFAVTTDAYRTVSATRELPALAPEAARRALLDAPVPPEVYDAIVTAYRGLGDDVPVAVRSSATAEDLPSASFAGQQDTLLNVVGADAVVDAVRRCWASLWTDRAVAYRDTNGIAQDSVYLAVVVQTMVRSAVSGVLFTANPVTGNRRQTVLDAAPGLGEAVVSGAVNPDHFVVEGDAIVERRPGDKRVAVRSLPGGGTEQITVRAAEEPCLTDDQIHRLTALGAAVRNHFGSPQDIEWAIDTEGTLHLTQSRPITTLFPLPDRDGFHVYFCFSLAQGLERPITPAGRAAFREIARSANEIVIGDPKSTGYTEAGERIFFDLTNLLRDKTGRTLALRLLGLMEARSAEILTELCAREPRLTPVRSPVLPAVRHGLSLARRYHAPATAVRALVRPAAAVRAAQGREPEIVARARAATTVQDALRDLIVPVLPTAAPAALTGYLMLALTGRIVRTEPGELQTVLRGLPNNVTTEMDLALGDLADEIRADPAAARAFRDPRQGPTELARAYRNGELSPAAQRGLAEFLDRWGHRAVAEIDIGVPRWSEDPSQVIAVISNLLRTDDPAARPAAVFARARADAEAAIEHLARRAGARGRLVRFALRRTRLLAGLREYPKYLGVRVLAVVRERISERGAQLYEQGRIDAPADVFFLDFEEMDTERGDLRQRITERKDSYARELRRRPVPRILLSDGTAPEPHRAPAAPGALTGTPASAGTATAPARVVTDPAGARLEPGEILVAPSTDPGWTPLFLTAGGLVMEMGGANSHGAVVAREYGIPAVVGVRGALEAVTTGDVVTVDGSTGVVTVAPGPEE
ncbi:PEP/pyruvate-binding domain-containing protein [Streptomyces qinzhouensis]|uniref:Phosphoenolpyruvate synthase n=1 Tax=Streptomyces qinzhouensis TaxID=2599401 RepID=A0A5B8J0V9_9ACTN|nr:PEP/pyruvate-binding domain-containing protein [Streptomyces qinzhouensis]QDY75325.1 phosphoenolpyruvate synthase [Streptomyces qinzhouensis]